MKTIIDTLFGYIAYIFLVFLTCHFLDVPFYIDKATGVLALLVLIKFVKNYLFN